MTDIEIVYNPFKPNSKTLKVRYEFRNMPHLVADKYGNFYILAHCKHKRTSRFKQLDNSKGYIYYQGNKIRMSTLRKRVKETNQIFEV